MTITKKTPKRRRWDWTPLVSAALANPGEWVCEDDPERSRATGHDIRHGMPTAFAPAGAFDARARVDGMYVRFLGVPIYPWQPHLGDSRSFEEVERTFDPTRFPDPERYYPPYQRAAAKPDTPTD